jgi:muramoyltetrapeptide carboxypeptidase LdcA involved in peptidoglycan recycling
VFNADIGHTAPTMTFISGAKVHLISKEGKGVIKQWV